MADGYDCAVPMVSDTSISAGIGHSQSYYNIDLLYAVFFSVGMGKVREKWSETSMNLAIGGTVKRNIY